MKINEKDLRKIIQEAIIDQNVIAKQKKIRDYFDRRNGDFGDVRIMYDILYQVLDKIIFTVKDDYVLDQIIDQVIDDQN